VKLYFHYCSYGFSNCYVLGTGGENDAVKEALIIDPGAMDEPILRHIEENEYTLRGVLITHGDINHVHGLKTLKRIYDTEIFAINPLVREHKTTVVRDGDLITIGFFHIEVIAVPGHSADSAVFRIDNLLFTGDTLSAGTAGRTPNLYAAANQLTPLRSKIRSLPGDYAVQPGHGPPTSLEAERRFNTDIHSFETRKKTRPVFRVDL
jgi:glyoxylase-like metal-dependent hydrolase (beta-lactamase superfamily II)